MPAQENKERYTPGPWRFAQFKHRPSVNFIETEHGLRIVGMSITEPDARLIAEAPNMFPLLKQYIMSHVVAKDGELCDCNDCRAAKRIVARVLGEE